MRALRKVLLATGLLLLPTDLTQAAGVDDANAAVAAARSGKYDDAIRLFTNAINSRRA
jgi:hypothetical protein